MGSVKTPGILILTVAGVVMNVRLKKQPVILVDDGLYA